MSVPNDHLPILNLLLSRDVAFPPRHKPVKFPSDVGAYNRSCQSPDLVDQTDDRPPKIELSLAWSFLLKMSRRPAGPIGRVCPSFDFSEFISLRFSIRIETDAWPYAIPSKGEMTTFRLHAFFCLSPDDIWHEMILSSHRDTIVHEQIVEAAFSMLRRPLSECRAILAIVRARLWRTGNEWQVVDLAECA